MALVARDARSLATIRMHPAATRPAAELSELATGACDVRIQGMAAEQTPRSGVRDALEGAAGFGAVSLVVYGTVAFAGRWLYQTLTETGAYAFWAGLYLLGAPWLLGKLLVAPDRRRWFVAWFVAGFLAYAAGWVAVYFSWRTKGGEWLASLVGPAAFALVLGISYRQRHGWLPGMAAMVAGHTVGYFLGDAANARIGGPWGMLLWGICHGLGYGAGLGWTIGRLERRAAGEANAPVESRVG